MKRSFPPPTGNLNQRCLLSLIVSLVLFIFTLTACTSTVYKTFTLQEGVGHFSFEYPEGYEVAQQEIIAGEPQNTMVSLRATSGDVPGPNPAINIAVMEPNPYAQNADGAMQFQMEILKQRLEFKLLEQSSVKVAGVKGIGAYFSYRSGAAGDTDSFMVFTRVAYFDAGGLVWLIYINPEMNDGKIDKTVFEHVLKTFKILD